MSDAQPAWSRDSVVLRLDRAPTVETPTPEWAFGGSTGRGVRVAVIDSGIDADHPALGDAVDVDGGVDVALSPDGEVVITPGPHGDVFGHGTACAGIIHGLAPEARITSVRVLGPGLSGKAAAFHAGLVWAVEQGFDVINLSLGTNRTEWALAFHEVCDRAYFSSSFVVTAANNVARTSYPSLFASVASVACNTTADPLRFHANPEPPTEFLARGIDVEVPWIDGGVTRATGNSYAAPHIAGLAALIRSKHPDLRPFQVKSVLWATSANVVEARAAGGAVAAPEGAGRRGTVIDAGRGTSIALTRHALRAATAEARPAPDRASSPDPAATPPPTRAPGATAGPERVRPTASPTRATPSAGASGRRGPWGPILDGPAVGEAPGAVVHELRVDPALGRDLLAALTAHAAVTHPHLQDVVAVRGGPPPRVVTPAPASDLAAWRRGAPISLADALAAALALVSGAAALHGAGLVHGDIRADGAVIDREGRVRLGWSGVAAAVGSPSSAAGASLDAGALRALAPEQLRGGAADAATDVHGLGLILCELLTGQLPHPEAAHVGELLRQRLGSPPRPAASLAVGLPPELGDLVDQMTATDARQRPRDARAVAPLLARVAVSLVGADALRASPLVRAEAVDPWLPRTAAGSG